LSGFIGHSFRRFSGPLARERDEVLNLEVMGIASAGAEAYD
jgi:hypothetical protein